MPKLIGVLSLQGGYDPHVRSLERLRAHVVKVRTWEEIDKVDALVIPGGESTTIGKLLISHGIMEPLRKKILAGLPVLGTCAGMILLSKTVEGPSQPLLAVLDITVRRNAYGSQVESFETQLPFHGKKDKTLPAMFIRAPQVAQISKDIRVLAEYEGFPVCVQQNNILAASFHPELTEDLTLHRYFLELVEASTFRS